MVKVLGWIERQKSDLVTLVINVGSEGKVGGTETERVGHFLGRAN